MTTPRSILITGCSSGIGLDAARTMAKRGWRVIATARKPADLAMLETGGLEALALDYADEGSVAACAEAVLERLSGAPDAVFHNGAYGQAGALEDITRDLMRQQFEANFLGWHDLTRRLLPAMRARGSGRIVLNSSVLGFAALGFRGPYNASKFALEGWAETLRIELFSSGLKVVVIEPGPITSKFRQNAKARFFATIDPERSAYRDTYRRQIARLESDGKGRFELPASAVTEKLVLACESANPAPVYRVTTPTHIMAFARRLLPSRAFTRFQRSVSERE